MEEYDRCGGQIVMPPRWQASPEQPTQTGVYDKTRKTPLRQAAEKRDPYERRSADKANR